MKKRGFLLLVLLTLCICPARANADVAAALQMAKYDEWVAQFPDRLPSRTWTLPPRAPPVPFAQVSTVRPPTLLELGETPYPADLRVAFAVLLERRLANTPHSDHAATTRFEDFLDWVQLRTATISPADPPDQESENSRWPYIQIKW